MMICLLIDFEVIKRLHDYLLLYSIKLYESVHLII